MMSPRPLAGVRVLELAGLAPAPFCGLLLADFGADVVRVDRASGPATLDFLSRGKRSAAIDIKTSAGVAVLRRLVNSADVLIEPFRPGVMERLGLGPDVLCAINPRLIYARLTGFGQKGHLANAAGHDINFIAMAGVLGHLGRSSEPPMFPINLLADFAGGGLICAFGIMAALLERANSGKGQVIDAAMADGAAYIASFVFNMHSRRVFNQPRGTNLLDSGAHFYEVYRTKDNKFMAVGAVEPQFYADLLKGLSLDKEEQLPDQNDAAHWPEMKKRFAAIFATKSRDEWEAIFSNLDACATPVLEPQEMDTHPFANDRQLLCRFQDEGSEVTEVAPAPKLSRSPAHRNGGVIPAHGAHTEEVLLQAGFASDEIRHLIESGTVVANGRNQERSRL